MNFYKGELVADKDCFRTERIGIFFDDYKNNLVKIYWINDGGPYFSTVNSDTIQTISKVKKTI